MLTQMDEYLFDLHGYLHLQGALEREHFQVMNDAIDAIPQIGVNEWYGYLHREAIEESRGVAYQQIYEAGEPFERLIDHPAWIEHVTRFVGGQDTFDSQHGPLFIDENFVSLRGPGEAIGLHSGGTPWVKRTQYHCKDGQFNCGQINILLALTDIGLGDGATMVIPGSHKSNFIHPQFAEHGMKEGASVDKVAGAVEVHMHAGDALLFVDAISHGSARRVNPGERRILVLRYGPSWGFFRHGYRPSTELLERLTPQRRAIVWPHEPWQRKPNHLEAAEVER